MAINIGSSSINSIYLGDTAVKSVYLGDNLVYSNEPAIIDDSYNYFVFDTTRSGSPTITTIVLQDSRGGDTTEWDGITDWGDGTADDKFTHTYAVHGEYTVKTRYTINTYSGGGDRNTRKCLVGCIGVNKNMTDYSFLFSGCTGLKTLDVSNWDTSKVTNMKYMFNGCDLTSLDLSSFDTSNVIRMNYMFATCSNITSLNLSFNTNSLKDISYMFYNCGKLALLDISNWNTQNVSNLKLMFNNCRSLTVDNIIMTNCNAATKKKIQDARKSANV